MRLWDIDRGEQLHSLKGHGASVNAVVVTPDSKRAISASSDHSLRIWDIDSGTCLLVLYGDAPFLAVAISPDGKNIVTGDFLGAVHFIEIHNLK